MRLKPDWCSYDSRDLTTHAVCVGMTGSGKTGLCLFAARGGRHRRRARDLHRSEGRPRQPDAHLSGSEARRLRALGGRRRRRAQGNERRRAGGENRGVLEGGSRRVGSASPSASRGCAPPPTLPSTRRVPRPACLSQCCVHSRHLQPNCSPTPARCATAWVGGVRPAELVSIDADPIGSREHILLANILEGAWRQGLSLDMTGLIQAVQKPPLRQTRRLRSRDLLPGEGAAQARDTGEQPDRLAGLRHLDGRRTARRATPAVHTPEGKPRIAIISIAHLNDAERMFIVTLVLNEMIAWMRSQSGTGSLRAIFYMDEIFGFFPRARIRPPSRRC